MHVKQLLVSILVVCMLSVYSLYSMEQESRMRQLIRKMSGTLLGERSTDSNQDTSYRAENAHAIADIYVQEMNQYLIAARQGNYERVRELLRKKYIDVDVLNDEGSNALHLALTAADQEDANLKNIVLLLISKGININVPIKASGETALEKAACKGFQDIVYVLLSRGAKFKDKELKLHKSAVYLIKLMYKLVAAVKKEDITTLEALSERMHVFLNEPRQVLQRLLHEHGNQLFQEHERIVREILEHDNVKLLEKVNDQVIKVRDNSGNTLLHMAIEAQAVTVVRYLLLEKLVDSLIANNKGETALATALRVTNEDNGRKCNMFGYILDIAQKLSPSISTITQTSTQDKGKMPLVPVTQAREVKPALWNYLAYHRNARRNLRYKIEEDAARLLHDLPTL